MKTFYYRHRPHIQPPGAVIFVTFRLYGSLPKKVLNDLYEEYEWLKKIIKNVYYRSKREILRHYNMQKRLLVKYDDCLHNSKTGPHFLKIPKIAKLVAEEIEYFDGKKYDLLSYCVMSNHSHTVFKPLKIREGEYHSLERIMHSIKSYTATEANKILSRKGKKFWTTESFNHYCRSEAETIKIIEYVLNNPVKAGLASKPNDWEWSYVKENVR